MDLKEYQKFCQGVAKKHDDPEKEIANWGLGIAGEADDVASCIKKTIAHNNDQTAGMKENLGDTMWYIAMICNHYGWSLDEVIEENVAKLKKRYPEGHFKTENAKREGTKVDWGEK